MCGCGTATWCAGGCACGCTHETLDGQRNQAQYFALQYQDILVRASDAYERAERNERSRIRTGVTGLFKRMWDESQDAPASDDVLAVIDPPEPSFIDFNPEVD